MPFLKDVFASSIKTKLSWAFHIPYMTKTLRKAIMKQTELETKYLKNKE